jgi:hypothetical protein
MRKTGLFIATLITGVIIACGSSKKSTATPVPANISVTRDRVMKSDSAALGKMKNAPAPAPDTNPKIAFEGYRASATMYNQLVHT